MALLPGIRKHLQQCNREHQLLLVRLRLLRRKERELPLTVKEERKIPVMKMSSLGVSIKNPQRDQTTQNTVTTHVPRVNSNRKKILFSMTGFELLLAGICRSVAERTGCSY